MVKKEEVDSKLATESRLTKVETNVNTIMTNHLPHIDAKLDNLDQKLDQIDLKLARFGGAIMIITFLASLIAQLALKYM